jgi:zinc transporter ZupT
MEATFFLKLVLMVAFFLEVTIFGNFISGLECFKNKAIMDLAMTFSGTLFLSIALIDVIPEAISSFD